MRSAELSLVAGVVVRRTSSARRGGFSLGVDLVDRWPIVGWWRAVNLGFSLRASQVQCLGG